MKPFHLRAIFVSVILGAGFGLPGAAAGVHRLEEHLRRFAARADIEENLAEPLDHYQRDSGRYPDTAEGLSVLAKEIPTGNRQSTGRRSYLGKRKTLLDPWGRAYRYASPGVHNRGTYDLCSYGPDGIESGDDVMNWIKVSGQMGEEG